MFEIYLSIDENYIEINQIIPFKRKISIFTPHNYRFILWTHQTKVINWNELGVIINEIS